MADNLKNSKLLVTLGQPMELYRGSRFDHSGNVLQVTLNNKYTFCGTERPESAEMLGFGLMNEFDIEKAQGYEQVAVGESFHKIGVGNLLKQDEQPYNFFHPYELQPLEYVVEKEEDDIILYKAKSAISDFLSLEYQKMISIHENVLLIEYFLVNKGKYTLKTSEYCHNFMAINNTELNQDFQLEFNFSPDARHFEEEHNIDPFLKIKDREISFKETPNGDIFIRKLNGLQSGKWWQLTNKQLGVGVREEVSFEANQVNLWGNAHVICPELFCDLVIPPGEERHWWRKFTFFENLL